MSPKSPSPDIGPRHGIAGAFYSGGPGEPYFQPVLECVCGWMTGRCTSWETAGAELDQHLEFPDMAEPKIPGIPSTGQS